MCAKQIFPGRWFTGVAGSVLLSLGAITCSPTLAQQSGADAADPIESDLLEGLNQQLLEGLDAPTAEPKPPAAEPSLEIDGEDIGQPAPKHPLVEIAQQMRQAQQRIAQRDTSNETQQLQEQILQTLDELIRQAEQQAAQSAQSQARAGREAMQGTSSLTDSPAQESTERLGQPRPGNPGRSTNSSGDELWGVLPERVRRSMQSAAIEQFLPSYAEMIEQYYRRLAEEEEGRP